MKKLLIIGTVFPEPDSSAAGSRMMQLIELFRFHNYEITFASAASDSEFMVDLESIAVHKRSIELNNASFDLFIRDLDPSIVVFDRFMIEEQFGWRVAENCPDALRILDTEDLHSLRSARQKSWKEKRAFVLDDLLTEDIAKREVAGILRCDLSLIISEAEMKILLEQFKIDKTLLQYLPFMLEKMSEDTIQHWKSFDERSHFISIGNFLHEPNWNAVQYLKESIWPLIRKELPKAELHVYGAYPSQKVNELNKPEEGFYIKGRAANAKEVVGNARVLLAPLRFGAGLKGKLAEAMQCGTPSVTTSIGAEAMHGNMEWSGVVADSAEDFAKAAVKLYTGKAGWESSQKSGIEIINSLYDKSRIGNEWMERIDFLIENKDQHRKNNFLGSMLMHHTVSGTKYMAKWIEEKAKK